MPTFRPSRLLLSAVLGALLLAGVACGPSFQAVYEGNARFEHCYALEENPQTPMPERASCWRDWSERYTYGQTRDRVSYATARYVALSEARDIPTDEALMMAAPGETPRKSTITAPAPTNAFAPPPKVLEEGDLKNAPPSGHPGEATANVPIVPLDAGPPAPAPTLAPALPASSCTETCSGDYRSCRSVCEADAGAKAPKGCERCEKTYAGCMKACFK